MKEGDVGADLVQGSIAFEFARGIRDLFKVSGHRASSIAT